VAVVPLVAGVGALPQATLLLLGKKRVCECLSVQCCARSHALTATETRVLEALCQGLEPREVAVQHGVGLATVRTQIGSIRAKTGAQSIRELVRRVAVLPPMVSSLRLAA
jgi:DNA-binding CsgD family transcriptional regulator